MKYRDLHAVCACLLAAAVLVLTPLKDAQAIPITFEFSGHITSILDSDNHLGGAVSEGDLFGGTLTYDPATYDSDPDSSEAAYWHDTAPYGISVLINGHSFRSDPNSTTFLAEVFEGSQADKVSLTSFSNLMPGLEGGLSLIVMELVDPTGQALSSTDLPTSYNLGAWSQELSGLTLWAGDCCISEYTLRGAIDNIENVQVDTIPEPGSILLIGSGVLGMLTLRRRQK
jgi:hypothetical protein